MGEAQACRICVSIGNRDLTEAVRIARQAATSADVIEIRLDSIADPSLPVFFSSLRSQLLFTNRPTWEGGHFAGPEEARIALLTEAVHAGAAYVDLELLAPAESLEHLRKVLAGMATRLILSRHDFSGTPPAGELADWVRRMHGSGADIGKIVTTARDHHDVLRVLCLQEVASSLDFPLIAFCMGVPGRMSRLVTCELGGFMTYCAADGAEAMAPGQIAVSEFLAIRNLLQSQPDGHQAGSGE